MSNIVIYIYYIAFDTLTTIDLCVHV